MEITYKEITTEKVDKKMWVAKTFTTKPLEAEVTMKGRSEGIAKQKLELFLKSKPYKHLDDL